MNNTDIAKTLNEIFGNVHPQIKISFTAKEQQQYESEIELHDEQGKFQKGTSMELSFSHIADERFFNMAKGSAKAFATILTQGEDIDSILESIEPSMLIIEHTLTDKTLSSIDDFAAKLGSIPARKNLMVHEYIVQTAQKAACEIDISSKEEEAAFFTIGGFQLSHTFPPMAELSAALEILAHNQKNWPILALWIKEWAGASQWSMEEAWRGGPLIEEILAYGTFTLMEKDLDPKNKPTWWADLSIMVDLCLEISPDDLKRAEFTAK